MWDSVRTFDVGGEDEAVTVVIGCFVEEGVCETGAAADY